MRARLCWSLALGLLAGAAQGADRRDAAVPPPPPPPADENRAATPGPAPDTNAFEPEVTITSKGTEIHEEYRYHGQIYMVKVTPAKGPPYYLIYDQSGIPRRSDLEPDIIPPTWVIKRF